MLMMNLGKGNWQLHVLGDKEWFPVSLPGEVHVALMTAERIPDPFVGDNERQVTWVAETDWEFEGRFFVPEDYLRQDKVDVCFDGLDTLAEVKLNGHILGTAQNAFRRYTWDIKRFLKPGENIFRIVFRSPVNYVKQQQESAPLTSPIQSIQGGPYLRKAPCQWGWDWGPQLPSIGVWRDAWLKGYRIAKLEQVHLSQTHLPNSAAEVSVFAQVTQWVENTLQVKLKIHDPDRRSFTTTAAIHQGSARAVVEIPDPVLWWPNGYGLQPLYHVQVTLMTDEGAVLDIKEYQLGLRTIELEQVSDAFGKSFTFVVNGTPIFAKGANWIPADSFPTRITQDRLESLLEDAAKANHNMIRVWGGGFYESETFYNLCDKYGLLVWQDFIFSCSVYPFHDSEFIANVKQEVIDNVSRLRHRASLALWCGNNEMDWGWEDWSWSSGGYLKYREDYRKFFYEDLPGWLEELDPVTPYWPSSPTSGTPFIDSNSSKTGDAHYWEVWHGAKPFTAYREQFPRFMSEFGFQSLPPLKTIAAFADERYWNLTDYMIEHHQRSEFASALFMGQMAQHFMMPINFKSLVYLTMVLQAEAIRYGVEHWRRNKHRVSGTLYWQLNDCWPVASWSSVDYFGRWKALHYASRRFFAPILLSIEEDQATASMKVYLTSDLLTRWDGVLRWRLIRMNGEVLENGEVLVEAASSSSAMVFEKCFDHLTFGDRRESIFITQLGQVDQNIAIQLATFVRNKHLKLVNPQITATVYSHVENEVRVELITEAQARFVELSLKDADVVFSDNYFDLMPGEVVQIICPLPKGWTVDDFNRSLAIFSLYDSFALL